MQNLIELWMRLSEALRVRQGEEVFASSFKAAEPISYENGLLTIGVYSTWEQEYLEQRHLNTLEKCAREALGIDLKARCVVVNTAPVQPAAPEPMVYGSNTITLNRKYTFDSFVVGESNRLAHAAAKAVAENPGMVYNPLFLYGGVGLGKTHLMHAIGHTVMMNNPSAKVVYVTSETFTNELIDAIQYNRNAQFREKYRNVDVLLIDDIQFIAGKESTQGEFFHTFNALHELNKQIIISSDRPPKAITTLEERLRSRFEWGLTTDIQPPDFETRIAILERKARAMNVDVDKEVITYIAENINTNIRELEGSLTRAIAYAQLSGVELNLEATRLALANAFRDVKVVTIDEIMKKVAEYYHLDVADIKGTRKTKDIAMARHVAAYLCCAMTSQSLNTIGTAFGRDHSTIMNSRDKVIHLMANDSILASSVQEIKNSLR